MRFMCSALSWFIRFANASFYPRNCGVFFSSKGLRLKVRLVNVGRELVSEFSTASFAEGELVSQRVRAPSFLT